MYVLPGVEWCQSLILCTLTNYESQYQIVSTAVGTLSALVECGNKYLEGSSMTCLFNKIALVDSPL